jgi:hypothetical protein
MLVRGLLLVARTRRHGRCTVNLRGNIALLRVSACLVGLSPAGRPVDYIEGRTKANYGTLEYALS